MRKIIHGNCLKEMPKIPDESIDMVLADPPYGTTACKWDSVIPLKLMWKQLKRVIKPNGAVVMTASQPFTTTLISSNMKMFKYCWVWNKKLGGNPLNAKIMPLKTTEDVVIFGVGKTIYKPIMRTGVMRTKGGSKKQPEHTGKFNTKYKVVNNQYYPTTIIEISNANNRKNRLHPTQKPVALMEYLIKTYTNEGETILDFAAGSGTTGVACQNLNRQFILIEKEAKYIEIIKQRLEQEK